MSGSNNVRRPAVRVTVDGAVLPGVIAAEVVATSHLAAARFSVRAALSLAGEMLLASALQNVEVSFGLDGEWVSAIQGLVDDVEVEPLRDEIRFDGRDYTARLIAQRTEETFENRTSSEVATIVALRRGLLPQVTATSTLTGRLYENGHSRTTLARHARAVSEWDLLTWLAELEGFDVYVEGQSLVFGPALAVVAQPLGVSSCVGLRLEKRLSLNTEGVIVRSWSSGSGRAVSASAGGTGDGPGSWVVVRPNLSEDEAQRLADRTLARLAPQARRIEAEMPGDLVTFPRTAVQLAGTGTEFDTTYVVTEVERRISVAGGFVQSVVGQEAQWTGSSI